VITRRLQPSLTPVVGSAVLAAAVVGHALARLPSSHLGPGGVDRTILAELGIGVALAVVAITVWVVDGARRSMGQFVLTRWVAVGLLAGAAVTGAVALLTEAGNGCLGACG
jgi:hypothetical protein